MQESSTEDIGSTKQQEEANTQNIPHTTIKLKILAKSLLYSKMFIILKGQDFIQTFHMITKQIITVKVCTSDFILLEFPPFLFLCIIGQYFYFYSDLGLLHPEEVEKAKISKMNVQCICRYKKGYFLGGYNRSPFPGGGFIAKRTIYYIEQFDRQRKNKPLWEIVMPKSDFPISIIEYQHPYLMCYISPTVYIINPENSNILVSFNREKIFQLYFIEGRYSYNQINLIGLYQNEEGSKMLGADVQKVPIFGVQINQNDEIANDICFSKDGRIFLSDDSSVYEFYPARNKKKLFKDFGKSLKVESLMCTHKNSLIVLVSQKQNPEEKKEQQQQQEKASEIKLEHPFKAFFQIFYLK